jgi:FtsH-binding integral membrane protein
VRQHLKNVYACLAMSTMAAAVGASIHLFTNIIQAGFLSGIGALIFFGLLMATPDDNGKGLKMRIGYLLGFTTLTGVGMGPLLEHVIAVDPSIIVTALIGTAVVFISFSICSLLAERGKWLYLGGTLMSLLTTLMVLSLANLFFGSTMLFQIQLYLGLFAMCGFVLYDTQLIIEKRRMGSKDFVTHSLDLFVDFIGIFRRILIILTQKVIRDRFVPFYPFISRHILHLNGLVKIASLIMLSLLQEQESQKKRRN